MNLYQGLDYQERQLVDISSGGNFLNTSDGDHPTPKVKTPGFHDTP